VDVLKGEGVTACRVCVWLGGSVCGGVHEGWVSERGWHVHVRVRRWGGTWQAWTDRRGGAAGYVCVCACVCVVCC
jgi:hypothetical protein